MSDSAMALPCRLMGVREGMGPELLPTVLFSPGVHGPTQFSLGLWRASHNRRLGFLQPLDCTIGANSFRTGSQSKALRIGFIFG